MCIIMYIAFDPFKFTTWQDFEGKPIVNFIFGGLNCKRHRCACNNLYWRVSDLVIFTEDSSHEGDETKGYVHDSPRAY